MFDDAISLISFIWSSLHTWFTPTFLFLFLNLMIGTIFIASSFNSSSSSSPSSPKPYHPDSATSYHQPQPQSTHLARAPSLLQRLKSINFTSYTAQSAAAAAAPEQQQQNNLSSASNPSHESAAQLGPSHKATAEKIPTWVETRALAEQKLSAQVSAQLMSQAQTQTQTQTHQTQTQTRAQFQMQRQAQTQTRTTRVPTIEEDTADDEEGPTLDEIYSRIKGTSPDHHHNRQNSDTVPANGEIQMKLPAKMKKFASENSAFNHFEADITTESPDSLTAAAMEEITAAMATTAGGGTEVDAMADDFINRFKKELQLQRNESIVRYKDMITRGSEQ